MRMTTLVGAEAGTEGEGEEEEKAEVEAKGRMGINKWNVQRQARAKQHAPAQRNGVRNPEQRKHPPRTMIGLPGARMMHGAKDGMMTTGTMKNGLGIATPTGKTNVLRMS